MAWEDVPPLERTPRGTVIYVLVDPRDETVRYVGVTRVSTMASRLERHLASPTNLGIASWFAQLGTAGLKPSMRMLSHVEDGRWQQAEMYWIAWFKARGRLYNVDGGGIYRTNEGKVRGKMERAAEHARRIVERELSIGRRIGPPLGLTGIRTHVKRAKKISQPLAHQVPQPAYNPLAKRAAEISARQMAKISGRPPRAKPTQPKVQRGKPYVSKFWSRCL